MFRGEEDEDDQRKDFVMTYLNKKGVDYSIKSDGGKGSQNLSAQIPVFQYYHFYRQAQFKARITKTSFIYTLSFKPVHSTCQPTLPKRILHAFKSSVVKYCLVNVECVLRALVYVHVRHSCACAPSKCTDAGPFIVPYLYSPRALAAGWELLTGRERKWPPGYSDLEGKVEVLEFYTCPMS